jgi:diketogulonate reductase-like aldo/keto reductase
MMSFSIAKDGFDPARVPVKTCYTGAEIPGIGMGTFGSDHAGPEDVARAVRESLSLGYRHLDCAAVYGNEPDIGRVLEQVFRSGAVKREDLWLTSKVWNNMHGRGDVLLSCARSLRDLKTEYLDLFLVHWPFPNHHPPGCDVRARNPHARPYIHEEFMETWVEMERLVKAGLVRHIGTSNMTVPKLKLLLRDCKIKPACNEMELHPHFQQPELFDFVVMNGIVPIGYSPLGSPNRPGRDRTEKDTVDMEDPVIRSIAKSRGIHPVSVCLKWAVQRGQIPIPMSTKRKNIRSNLESVLIDPLSGEEMEQISRIDKNCRLIKGHVFLWKDAQSWEDLWDPEGVIVSG